MSPLAHAPIWDAVADAYLDEILPIFERVAERALDAVAAQAGEVALDVACGPGTLSVLAARRGLRVHALDLSTEMVRHLEGRAAGLPITAVQGDGQALPHPDASFDVAFSLFGLMFFPDRHAGLSELRRVLRPDGRVALTSWGARADVPHLATFFSTLIPHLPFAPPPPAALPLADPSTAVAELEAAGFIDVAVDDVPVAFGWPSAEAWVDSFGRSNAHVVLARHALGAGWPAARDAVVAAVRAAHGDGEVRYTSPANLIVGRVPLTG